MAYSYTVDETASTLTPTNVIDALPPPTDGRIFKLLVTANLNGSTLAQLEVLIEDPSCYITSFNCDSHGCEDHLSDSAITLNYSNSDFPSLVLPPFTSTGDCDDDDYSTIDYDLFDFEDKFGASVNTDQYPATLNFNPPTTMSSNYYDIDLLAWYQG